MEPKNSTVRAFPTEPKEKRPYGKAPLELDLPQASEAVGQIAQQGRALPDSKLAIVLGNTITSSAFSRKIRALVAYGLLTESTGSAGTEFILTELALSIALPRSPESQMEAKKQSFLKLEQFAFLFSQHKGKLLPADEFLRNILEQECGIPRDVSDVWVRQFKSAASAAGLFFVRADGKIQIAESPIVGSVAEAIGNEEDNPKSASSVPVPPGEPVQPIRSAPVYPVASGSVPPGHTTRIELSDGRHAQISIPDKISVRDAQKLQKALEGVKVIIESMVTEEGGAP